MQITDEEIIRKGENELIDAISAEIDWDNIEEIFRKEHKLRIDDDVEYKRGDIVVYNDQIAYQLEFQVNVGLSIIMDRQGHYLAVSTNKDIRDTSDKTPDKTGPDISPMDEHVQNDPLASAQDVLEMGQGTEEQKTLDMTPGLESEGDGSPPSDLAPAPPDRPEQERDLEADKDAMENIARLTSQVGELMDELNS